MTRLTNRVAVQTFLTAVALVAGLVAFPRALTGASLPGQVVAALPLLAALGLWGWGLRLRAELHRARARAAALRAGGAQGRSPAPS